MNIKFFDLLYCGLSIRDASSTREVFVENGHDEGPIWLAKGPVQIKRLIDILMNEYVQMINLSIQPNQKIMKNELRVRLMLAADNFQYNGLAVRELLEEAGNELEAALDILDECENPKAKAFVKRHSTPMQTGSSGQLSALITGDQVIIEKQ